MTRINTPTALDRTPSDTTIADARTTAEQRAYIETKARAALNDLREAFGHDVTGTWPQFQLRYRTAAETREAFPLSGATAAWVQNNVKDVININIDHPDLKTGDGQLFDHVLKCDVSIGCSPGEVWETGVTTLQTSRRVSPDEQP